MRALILFGRAAMTTLAVISAAFGFLVRHPASRARTTTRKPTPPASARCWPLACAVIALMLVRRRVQLVKLRKLEARCR